MTADVGIAQTLMSGYQSPMIVFFESLLLHLVCLANGTLVFFVVSVQVDLETFGVEEIIPYIGFVDVWFHLCNPFRYAVCFVVVIIVQ